MHIASYKNKERKTASSDTPNKNGTQQKKYPFMLFENNVAFQKWYMTNSPPKIDIYDIHKKWCLTAMAHLAKKYPKVPCQGLS